MTWSAPLPGAALRMMRTAAGRRALHVALLVGGLFVLGVLCGERAQAAGGAPPSPRDAVGQVVDVLVEGPREGRGPAVTAENVVRSVEGRALGPVGDVVGDTVETVTEGLGFEAVAQTEVPLPSLSPSPPPPPLPSLSSMPPLSALPDPVDPSGPSGPPDLPGLSGLLGRSMPVGTDPQPGPPATVPDTSGAADDPGTAVTSDTPDTSGATDAGTSDRAGGAAQAAYGPEQVVEHVVRVAPAAAHVDTHRAEPAPTEPAPTEPAPAHRAPTGDPDGTLGSASGADQGPPRQGDAHALTPHHRIPFRLVPGALARADAAETQDRYRDIPVSPA
ncbi:hypothetical protein [Streptomyces sp. DH41]|uniref:hypothetical protein n=1 Tax=Streptomyces sp. DH41 TaxID=3040125 RepID=UPI00244319C3|nr:hypothetical protein [Streptomyces sp. DH41]MDG9722333.1 hypothetical protein [Streptomyces sp. DH41]